MRRIPYEESPKRYEYILTQKGLDLYPIIMSIVHWGNIHMVDARGRPMLHEHKACGKTVRSRDDLLRMRRAGHGQGSACAPRSGRATGLAGACERERWREDEGGCRLGLRKLLPNHHAYLTPSLPRCAR